MALSEKMKDRIEMVAAALLIGAAVAGSGAMAQRDPAYQQARADGLIGEKTDGYLGFVTSPSQRFWVMEHFIKVPWRRVPTHVAAHRVHDRGSRPDRPVVDDELVTVASDALAALDP